MGINFAHKSRPIQLKPQKNPKISCIEIQLIQAKIPNHKS